MRKPARNQLCWSHSRSQLPRTVQRGFTLIELLVSMLIIIILVSLYWGGGSDNGGRGKKSCAANLQKIYVALETYASDNAGQFPTAPGVRTSEDILNVLVPRYTVDTSIFTCPASKDPQLPSGESIRGKRISYAYFMGLAVTNGQEVLMTDRLIDTNPKEAGQPLFSTTGKPPGNNHKTYGGNLLFADGRVEASPAKAPFSLVLPTGVVLLNPQP
jgi:prepilin-type N-terminal cleavage/methylation domain-containing protein/prepilin-type processing-associated H-X9-DG protein